MKILRAVLPVFLLAAAVYAQDVRYNFAADEDFSRYKTYKWVQVKDAQQLDQIADEQLKSAVNAELAKKGLTLATGDDADLFIAYQVALNQEKQFTSFNTGWGYGPGWGGGWYGPGGMTSSTTTGSTSTIHVGSLDLDMYDAQAKKLVWRGTVSKTLNPKAKPGKRQKNLTKAVAKLLKNYPPPQKKA
jgi:hypothetical protein